MSINELGELGRLWNGSFNSENVDEEKIQELHDYINTLYRSEAKHALYTPIVFDNQVLYEGNRKHEDQFRFDYIDVKDKTDVFVKKDGAKQILDTDYTISDHATLTEKVSITFSTAPKAARTNTTGTAGSADANVTLPAESVEIYIDQWYTLHPTQDANYYLGDDVPIAEQNTFVVPIHQKADNYTLRVFSDSPFPLALTSMAWEGNYSPRYYRRT